MLLLSDLPEINAEFLLKMVSIEHREGALAGLYEVLPGKNPEKPVVREKESKQLVKGSGRYPGANDPAEVGKKSAFKRTASYREAMEQLVALDGGPDQRGSFAWFLNRAYDAAEGKAVRVECFHEGCDDKHLEAVAFKPDAKIIFSIIEMMAGKATQAIEIDVNAVALTKVLQLRTVEVVIHMQDPAERARRIKLLDLDVED